MSGTMTIDEAVRIVREQTIPALRGSGGDGHADAIEAVLAGSEVLAEKLSLMTEDYIKHRNALERAETERDELRAEAVEATLREHKARCKQ
jgi:hypothetical protein